MTYYFYDLETSGFDPRYNRVMQFAGQRTDEQLKPIGEPLNVLIKMSEDTLPSPEAVLVTGITPQMTIAEGYSEAQFLQRFVKAISQPQTVVLGYNSIRFDDEFIRNMLYRNFYDPYEWQWQDERSKWDLLDVGRMMRALRPEGAKWPVDKDGKPTNSLEFLTKENSIEHSGAHDALADVEATIALAKLFHGAQPKLFEYLLKMRDKKEVSKLVNPDDPKPFVYTSGRYDSHYAKTTIAFPIGVHPHVPGQVLVYDLRIDPSEVADMSIADMVANLTTKYQDRDDNFKKLPIKTLATNRCPAVAPLGVMDDNSWKRIGLDFKTVIRHVDLLSKNNIIGKTALGAWDEYGKPRKSEKDVDGQIYEGFFGGKDKALIVDVRKKNAEELADFHPDFVDERLPELLFRYKARNFPNSLSEQEMTIWQEHVTGRLAKGIGGSPSLEKYMKSIGELAKYKKDNKSKFLLEELKLYGESLVEAES